MENYKANQPIDLKINTEEVTQHIDSKSIFGINHRYAFNGYGTFDSKNMKMKDEFVELYKDAGFAYWGAIEYWGESNGWPKKGWNYSFFNHALEPYPQAYLIKSAFSDEPLVHIGVVDSEKESIEWNDVIVGRMPLSSHWNRAEGSKQNLFTYTNADEVELLVNGKSLGIQKNNL